MLQDKVAVVYGGGGAVGGAVAEAFARNGARVVLAGRRPAALERTACRIWDAGGRAEALPVDAMDAAAVDRHAGTVVERFGRIDISFNAIELGETQGGPLVDMTAERFARPVTAAATTHFLTATAAARHMIRRKGGVILALTAQVARKPYPDVGGFGVAGATIEALCRQLAVELGPHGIRVVCLRSAGSPDAPGVGEALRLHARIAGITEAEQEARVAAAGMLKRMPRLAEIAGAATLMASDHASAVTAEVLNLTGGELAD